MRAWLIALIFTAWSGAPAQAVDVLTFHGGESRLGWNSAETKLTPASVKSGAFGKRWQTALDGGVRGAPLYVSDLEVAGTKHNVVYAATENNSVFALDAATGAILWSARQLAPPLSEAQWSGNWFNGSHHGILSTPVIDRSHGILYTCGVRARGLRQLFQVWGLDLTTGSVKTGWPVTLKGHSRGAAFEAGQVMQRGALSLVNGWLYIPFGGRGDTPPWRGWLIGVDTLHPGATQQAFCSSPQSDGAGIWSGGGIAADSQGNLYLTTGNGDFDIKNGGANLAQSVIRLRPQKGDLEFSGKSDDLYTPANYKYLDEQDEDLGGATALILPDQPETSTPHLLFTGGKDGLAYLLNRDHLGGIGGEIQKMRLFCPEVAPYHEGIRSTASYFDAGVQGRFLFVAGDQEGPDSIRGIAALKLEAAAGQPVHMKLTWVLKHDLDGPSSVTGSSSGTDGAIVWVIETKNGDNSALLAYDALTGEELYNNTAGPVGDHFNGGRRFTSPIVADGNVFVGAEGVVCFGLLDRKVGGAK